MAERKGTAKEKEHGGRGGRTEGVLGYMWVNANRTVFVFILYYQRLPEHLLHTIHSLVPWACVSVWTRGMKEWEVENKNGGRNEEEEARLQEHNLILRLCWRRFTLVLRLIISASVSLSPSLTYNIWTPSNLVLNKKAGKLWPSVCDLHCAKESWY